MICLSDVFLRKGITGAALNTFPNVLLIFNKCQCLLTIYLIFSKVELCVTENGIKFFRTALVLLNRVYFFDLVSNDVFFVPFFHESFNQVI